MTVIVNSIPIAGVPTKLLASNTSRVALVVFSDNIGQFSIGPEETLTVLGALWFGTAQHTLILKRRRYGIAIAGEIWYNGTSIGDMNCIEIIQD
jgi:hypothetical protein